jgi:hypothetical protein
MDMKNMLKLPGILFLIIMVTACAKYCAFWEIHGLDHNGSHTATIKLCEARPYTQDTDPSNIIPPDVYVKWQFIGGKSKSGT